MFKILRIAAVERRPSDSRLPPAWKWWSSELRFVLHNSGEGTSQECVDWDSFWCGVWSLSRIQLSWGIQTYGTCVVWTWNSSYINWMCNCMHTYFMYMISFNPYNTLQGSHCYHHLTEEKVQLGDTKSTAQYPKLEYERAGPWAHHPPHPWSLTYTP